MFNPVSYLFLLVGSILAGYGLIDRDRAQRIADLAWPRFLTMFARDLYRVADIAMVGLAVGPAAIAGLAFATIYWGLANSFSLGLSGGTISQVSQRYGAERYRRLDLAIKQSILIGIAVTVPFIVVYWFFANALIGLVGVEAEAISLGAAYLQVISIGLLFNLCNHAASRSLAGADDTWIAMSLRASGAFLNIFLNAIFIFGLGWGVVGAAIGTVIAEGVITVCFTWGFLRGRLPIIGEFPVRISPTPPYFDRELTKQLLTISPPLIAQYLAHSFVRFPLFAILAMLGPTVVAAFEVARRIRKLMGGTSKGFSMAAAGIIGQELGRNDEAGAQRFASDVIRFSLVIYAISIVLVFAFARPLAHLFANDPEIISQTVPFIRVGAISFLALGLSESIDGILRAAGDNRWILYGQLSSQYVVLIPTTFLGVITPLGIIAVFIAMLAETATRVAIIGYRFNTGKWRIVSRLHRPSMTD